MTHSHFDSKITEFVLGELEGKELNELRIHLEGCEECALNIESLKEVLNIYGTVPFDMPSDTYFASLVPQIRTKLEERNSIFSGFNFFFSPRWAGAVSVVIVAAVSTLLLLNIQNRAHEENNQIENIYYSGALHTEIITIAAISETFNSEDWDFLSEIIDDEIGEYRNLFDYDSEDYNSIDFLGDEEWEEFYEKFNNQQIL
ncbi:MAG: zf-HC2 domain-containing protein [Candidatus Marinimicrobia bacterium]|nr:zf-HC2 domain-containing protein [Candidatus Neomarinimicrobiota bacterium]